MYFLMKLVLRVSILRVLLVLVLVSVNDLKSKIVSGVVFVGFDGGLFDRFDWWVGIRYYNSFGWGYCSLGYIGKMFGWECVIRGYGVNLKGNLNGVVGVWVF